MSNVQIEKAINENVNLNKWVISGNNDFTSCTQMLIAYLETWYVPVAYLLCFASSTLP